MRFMNEYEVEGAVLLFQVADAPNLLRGANILSRFMDWTNANSDGWPYWQKPARAAGQLMELLQSVDQFDPIDVTEGELARTLQPIKAFLTRQGVDHSEVI